jgi:hypothetical protein
MIKKETSARLKKKKKQEKPLQNLLERECNDVGSVTRVKSPGGEVGEATFLVCLLPVKGSK